MLFLYKYNQKYDSGSFLDFYQQIVDEARLKGKIRTANTEQKYIEKLKKFSGQVSFSDLSAQFAKDFEKWMLEKGNKINTVASNFKSMYAVLNKAVKMGIIKENPLRACTLVTENVEKNSLTYEEITKLSELEIPTRFKWNCNIKIGILDLFLPVINLMEETL